MKATVSAVSLSMRFHAGALCSFWAMMAIVMQNTAVCRVAEASLRTVRALRRPQRALQRPLRHAQSLPFPVSLIGRKAKSATNSLLYNLQRLSVSRVLPGGTMAGSAIHAGSAPELPCRWPTTVVCSRMFMTRAAGWRRPSLIASFKSFFCCFMRLGQLFLLCPASYGVLSNSFFDARGHRSRTMLKSHKSVMKITKSCRKV